MQGNPPAAGSAGMAIHKSQEYSLASSGNRLATACDRCGRQITDEQYFQRVPPEKGKPGVLPAYSTISRMTVTLI